MTVDEFLFDAAGRNTGQTRRFQNLADFDLTKASDLAE